MRQFCISDADVCRQPSVVHRLMPGVNRLTLLAVLFLSLFTLVWAGPLYQISYAQQQEVREYELKAVYLYNFLQFVQWPESRKPLSRDNAMIIGIIGDSPFGDALDELREDVRKSGMRPVRIVHYGSFDEDRDFSSCHLLFVSSSERKNFRKIVAALGNAPVLTVADSEGFISAGGMINLVQSGGKVRWTINRTAADRAGLRFSSQLLSMALKVVEGH